MILNSTEANAVTAVMFLTPLTWVAWNIFRTARWRSRVIALPVLALLLFMGVILLCGHSPQTRILSRSGGQLMFVDLSEAALFTHQSKAILLPRGAWASVKEELQPVKRKARYSGSHYTSFGVYLGTPAQEHWMDRFRDRVQAQAQADALNGFVRGDAPRMELPRAVQGDQGVSLFMGGFIYLLGLGGCTLVAWRVAQETRPPEKIRLSRKRKASRR